MIYKLIKRYSFEPVSFIKETQNAAYYNIKWAFVKTLQDFSDENDIKFQEASPSWPMTLNK